MDSLIEVAIAAKRCLADALDSIHDDTYGAPELSNAAPAWQAALTRAVLRRPTWVTASSDTAAALRCICWRLFVGRRWEGQEGCYKTPPVGQLYFLVKEL